MATYEQNNRGQSTLDPSLLGTAGFDPSKYITTLPHVQQFQTLPSPWDAMRGSVEGAEGAITKLAQERLDPVNAAQRETELSQQKLAQNILDRYKTNPQGAAYVTDIGPNGSVNVGKWPAQGGVLNPFIPPPIVTPNPTNESLRKTDQGTPSNTTGVLNTSQDPDPDNKYTQGISASLKGLPSAPGTVTQPLPSAATQNTATRLPDAVTLASGSPAPTTSSDMNISGKPIPESPVPVDTPVDLSGANKSPQEVLDWYKNNIDTRGAHARLEMGPDGQPTGRTVIIHDPKSRMADQVVHPGHLDGWTPPDTSPSETKPKASLAAAPPQSTVTPAVTPIPSYSTALDDKLSKGQITPDDLIKAGGQRTASSAPGPGPTPTPVPSPTPPVTTPSGSVTAPTESIPTPAPPSASQNGQANTSTGPSLSLSSGYKSLNARATPATPSLPQDTGTGPTVKKALPVDSETVMRANQIPNSVNPASTFRNEDGTEAGFSNDDWIKKHYGGLTREQIRDQVAQNLSKMEIGKGGEITLTGQKTQTVPITVPTADGGSRTFTAFVEPVSGKIYTPQAISPYKEERVYLDGSHATVENDISKENDLAMEKLCLDKGTAAYWDGMTRNQKIDAYRLASSLKNTTPNETFTKQNNHIESVLDQGEDLLQQIKEMETPEDPEAINKRSSWNMAVNDWKGHYGSSYPQWANDNLKNLTNWVSGGKSKVDIRDVDVPLAKLHANYINFLRMVRGEDTPRPPGGEKESTPDIQGTVGDITDAQFPEKLKQYLNTQKAALSRQVDDAVTNQWRISPSAVLKGNQAHYGNANGSQMGGDYEHPIFVTSQAQLDKIPNKAYITDYRHKVIRKGESQVSMPASQ